MWAIWTMKKPFNSVLDDKLLIILTEKVGLEKRDIRIIANLY